MAENKKNPKEASNIFHSIMKASVKPNKDFDFDGIIDAVKDKFGIELIRDKDMGFNYPKGLTGEQVSDIQKYIRENL